MTLAEQATVGDLIAALAARTGNQKQHFVRGDALRPGILVMVNDVDWELEGREAALLSGGDRVVFLSNIPKASSTLMCRCASTSLQCVPPSDGLASPLQ